MHAQDWPVPGRPGRRPPAARATLCVAESPGGERGQKAAGAASLPGSRARGVRGREPPDPVLRRRGADDAPAPERKPLWICL